MMTGASLALLLLFDSGAPVAPQAAPAHGERHAQGVVAFDLTVEPQGGALDLLTAVAVPGGFELRHRRSRDGGATWSAEHRLPVAPGDLHSPHRGSDPQIAGFGDRLLAVWTRPGTSSWGSGPLGTAISEDGGATWSAGPNPADDGSTDGHAYIDAAADAKGALHLVWLDNRDGGQGLRAAASSDGGHTWSANRTLDARTCECCWNRVAAPKPGEAIVLYRDKEPRDMASAATADGGKAWTPGRAAGAFNWSFEGCPHVGGGLAVDGSAAHALVWSGSEAQRGLHALESRDGGRSWAETSRVGKPSAHRPDLAASGSKLAAVWDDPGDANRAVYAATSIDGGRSWSGARRLSDPAASASHPVVVALGGGQFRVAWTEAVGDGPLAWRSAAF
ncbi:MAG TPA: sialidase family protein [Vicinamibacteria bacterium]